MKALGLTAFAATLFVALAAQGGDDETLKKENAALQGVWKITKFENPKGEEDGNLAGATLDFDKDGKNLTFTHNGETKKGAFRLNPAGKPKEIDISPANEDKTHEGIYQVEKSTLKICLTMNPGDGRPSEFATKDGKGFVLITLEKQK
jgi:uncharacterized protein (TIGR03067 family)